MNKTQKNIIKYINQEMKKRLVTQKQKQKQNKQISCPGPIDLTIQRTISREFILMPNIQFHLNRMSSPSGTFIQIMHNSWRGNYILLQSNHCYIQWLFPNSFKSRFNQKSYPLTKQQKHVFMTNVEIGKRYVKSYQMMLEFFGMKLASRVTGQVVRSIVPNFKDRYDQTLLSAYHNHLRITRILCSLTELGFAFYARELCNFLKKEIYQHNGKLIRLKHMDVYKHWRPYEGDNKKRSNKINIQDQPNIYLKQLWKAEGYNPLRKQISKWSESNNKNKTTIQLNDEQSDNEKCQIKLTKLQKKQNKIEQKRQLTKKQSNKIEQCKKIQQLSSGSQTKSLQNSVISSNFSSIQQQQDFRDEYRHLSNPHPSNRLALTHSKKQQKRYQRLQHERQLQQKKLQLHVQLKLQQQNDNYVKRQMKQIRKNFQEKLKEFTKKGRGKAETIQERETRMMGRGHRYRREVQNQEQKYHQAQQQQYQQQQSSQQQQSEHQLQQQLLNQQES